METEGWIMDEVKTAIRHRLVHQIIDLSAVITFVFMFVIWIMEEKSRSVVILTGAMGLFYMASFVFDTIQKIRLKKLLPELEKMEK